MIVVDGTEADDRQRFMYSSSCMIFVFQLKNAESILEYERMAEIGFDKRDFRMVCEIDVEE